ncbi:MAG: hypothetical protein NTY08_18800 [Proteobacteria bacterium]|nr:hypothetical protein [Pseudomonadota bacterium]
MRTSNSNGIYQALKIYLRHTFEVYSRKLAKLGAIFGGHVGIGTTTPGAKLEVAGTPGTDGIKFPDGTTQTTAASGSMAYVLIVDEKASGTNGGTCTSGSWQTRVLNTLKSDAYSNLTSLASNQFKLAAGTYICQISAPARSVLSHMVKLRNVTAGTDIMLGTSERVDNDGSWAYRSRSVARGRFVVGSGQAVAATDALEVQHRCSSTVATNGFGIPASFGVVETYSIVECWKQ